MDFAGYLYINKNGEAVVSTQRPSLSDDKIVFLEDDDLQDTERMNQTDLLELYLSTARQADDAAFTPYLKVTGIGAKVLALYQDAQDAVGQYSDYWSAGKEYWKSLVDDMERLQAKMGFGTSWILNVPRKSLETIFGIVANPKWTREDKEALVLSLDSALEDYEKFLKKHRII